MARLEQPSLNVIGRINLIEPCCEISAAITNTSYHLLSLHPTLLLFFVYVFVIGIQFLLGYAIGVGTVLPAHGVHSGQPSGSRLGVAR